MMKHKHIRAAFALFSLANCCFVFAGFLSPYAANEQHRDFAYAPPMRVHFLDDAGHLHLRPFIYATRVIDTKLETQNAASLQGGDFEYAEDRTNASPLRFLVRKNDGLHLFGVDAPSQIFILGTDGFGRDLFSRILFGGRISLGAALLATVLSLVTGVALGAIAGYFGGTADTAIMRGAELALAIPWLYLLLAIRAALPLHVPAAETFLLISAVIGIIGWARPARLVRGVVLSEREHSFVAAARGFGASEWYLLRRHVLPQTAGIVITQAVTLVPQFIVAEATLSFLGLGMSEPFPSWGNLLSVFQQFQVMSSYWWMAAPLGALVLMSLLYFTLADALQARMSHLESRPDYA